MRNVLVTGAILVGLVGLIALSHLQRQQNKPVLRVTQPQVASINQSILASGNLVFQQQVQLSSEVTARVAKIYVDEGQLVEQGDLLMSLDATAFEAEAKRLTAQVQANQMAVAAAKLTLINTDRQYQRQLQLAEQNLLGQQQLDDKHNATKLAEIEVAAATARLVQAQAALSIAQDRVNKSQFYAPISGLLASVDIKAGETVIAGTTNIVGSTLMLIADPQSIIAELAIDESDIASIKLGQQASITAAAYPDYPFSGKVVSIGSAAKVGLATQGLSFKVKVLLDGDDKTLFAGMSCRAEIVTAGSRDSVTVPIEAVQSELVSGNTRYFVWRVDQQNQVHKNWIEPGLASDTKQAITSGLQLEDALVIGPARPLASLQQGQQIEIEKTSSTNEAG